jgi:hypothetical protein
MPGGDGLAEESERIERARMRCRDSPLGEGKYKETAETNHEYKE